MSRTPRGRRPRSWRRPLNGARRPRGQEGCRSGRCWGPRCESTAEWTLADGVELDLAKIRLDVTNAEGQTRTISTRESNSVYEGLIPNSPVTPGHGVVWQANEEGANPPRLVFHSPRVSVT